MPSGVNATQFDAVIAGGGLSGLSLAAHLAAGPWRDRAVLLVDDGGKAPAAAGWASWSAGAGLLDGAVTRSYRQIRVSTDGQSRVLLLGRYRYQVVCRAALERAVLALLADCSGFQIRRGRVDSVRSVGDTAEVIVDGETVRGSWAFDSVSRASCRTTGPEVDARLAFTGWEVSCVDAVFDPDIPVLFDFSVPSDGRARFVYVLPDGPHRALVELTEFTGRGTAPSRATERQVVLAGYLERFGRYEIARAESAVLPLRVHPPPRRHGRVMLIGNRGGLLKASTGYAYQRIQRDSAAMAASLAHHGHPFAVPGTRPRHRFLDAVFLAVLDRDPTQLERAFARLFLTNPAERVLRFLDEDSGLADEIRLAASLPPSPYLRAALVRRHAPRAAGAGDLSV